MGMAGYIWILSVSLFCQWTYHTHASTLSLSPSNWHAFWFQTNSSITHLLKLSNLSVSEAIREMVRFILCSSKREWTTKSFTFWSRIHYWDALRSDFQFLPVDSLREHKIKQKRCKIIAIGNLCWVKELLKRKMAKRINKPNAQRKNTHTTARGGQRRGQGAARQTHVSLKDNFCWRRVYIGFRSFVADLLVIELRLFFLSFFIYFFASCLDNMFT